jgi:hypothetical protein
MMEEKLPPKYIYAAAVLYLGLLLVLAIFPFSATGMPDVNKMYAGNFRLDHILHLLAFMPLYPLGWHVIRPKGRLWEFVLLVILITGLSTRWI